jgi:cytochrome c-type biogenesis protein CcmF
LIKNHKIDLPRIISHTGFGFLILFIGLNYNFSLEKDFNLKLGETKKFENYSVNFQDLKLEDFKNYKAVVGKFIIKNSKNSSEQLLNPEIRIYENPNTLTYEASIRSGLLKDYYITMSNIDRSDYYNIKFQKKPFMIWIWISVIFVSLGGFLRFFKNAKTNY